MSIDEAVALKAVRDGLEGSNVPIVHEEIRVVLAMALERDTLRAQLAAVTRERDAKEREVQRLLNVVCDSPACTAAVIRCDDGSRVCAAGHSARWVNVDLLRMTERERDALKARVETAERDLESLWVLLRYERLRVAELGRVQDAAFRDAHRAEADAARLREALTQVRDAMLATGQEPDGDDDPRRPVAAAVWRALASAPSAETWRQVGQHAAHPELDATPSAEPTPRAKAEAFFAGFAGDDDAGVLAWSEPSAEPTPRDMRVAEAVREAYAEVAVRYAAGFKFERDVLAIDLAAVVAKAVKP